MAKPQKSLKLLIGIFIFTSILATLEIILIFFSSSIRKKYFEASDEISGFIFGSIIVVILFLLLAFGVKRLNKFAYIISFPLSIIIIFRLQPFGLIVFILIIVWLIKTRKLFFKNKNSK